MKTGISATLFILSALAASVSSEIVAGDYVGCRREQIFYSPAFACEGYRCSPVLRYFVFFCSIFCAYSRLRDNLIFSIENRIYAGCSCSKEYFGSSRPCSKEYFGSSHPCSKEYFGSSRPCTALRLASSCW
jgi:hypothetical protein